MGLAREETEAETPEKFSATTAACRIEGESLVLLQVNCGSICNKTSDFWNVVDTYDPDVARSLGLERKFATPKSLGLTSQLLEETGVAAVGGVFVCFKNSIAFSELWVDEDFEMIAVK
jgi:hypothetical protein